jgi:hypothetical protein
MKKSKIIKAILSPIIKGLAIFAVFGFALYVYGAISYPENEPNPVTGVVGIFVGLSGTTNVPAPGSYNNASAKCSTSSPSTTYAGSHVCTAMEIINTYNNYPSVFDTLTGTDVRGWINNGPPGYTATPANDCGGWQVADGTKYGAIWLFNSTIAPKQASLQTCNNSYPFACCK